MEFATIFAGLGVHTTIIYRRDCLLRGFDEDMCRGLEAGLIDRSIKIIYQTTIARLARDGADITATFSDGVTTPYGAVMLAAGRPANVAGQGLEQAASTCRATAPLPWTPIPRPPCPSSIRLAMWPAAPP
ncbi:MAG: FAD-dependent oxidoreductase [Candidatus Devosia euplotis]|nr:FAD-dependent oxidoreductase [Candidatus Devosia euplotis]